MPSLQTIFLLATAAIASFTSAAPLGALPGGLTTPLSGVNADTVAPLPALGVVPGLNKAPGVNARALPALPVDTNVVTSNVGTVVPDALGGVKRGAPTPDSLPVILEGLEAKLHDLLEDLDEVVGVSVDVDVHVVLPILHELLELLGAVLVSVKALLGLPFEVICALSGKVLSLVDIAHLLCAVLTLICQILALVSKVVGAAGAEVVKPLIAEIAGVVGEILSVVFQLLAGLLALLVPLLGEVIEILLSLDLFGVLDILKVAHP